MCVVDVWWLFVGRGCVAVCGWVWWLSVVDVCDCVWLCVLDVWRLCVAVRG